MMTKIEIHSGPFAGNPATLVERGEDTSKVRVRLFGRETDVDLPNDSFTTSDEPFDPFSSFAAQIRTDRFWEAGEATRDWWLAREADVSSQTWEEHLQLRDAVESRVAEETERLLQQLRDAVPEGAGFAEIDAHFRAHEEVYRPFRVRWRESTGGVSEAETRRSEERGQKVAQLQRRAFRAWWAAQPRETAGCEEFLQEARSGEDYVEMVSADYEAFNRWGREAVELIFNHYRDENIAVRELDQLPEEHPWRARHGADAGEVVRQIFAPVWHRAPELFARFAFAVRAIYTIEISGTQCLLYACDAEQEYGEPREHLSLVVGGPALSRNELDAVDERLSEYVRSCGWSVPSELRELYSVHHGLGRLSSFSGQFDNAGSIYPAEQLSVLGEMMNDIAEEQNFEPDGYRFDDLLNFFEDGAGNGENFFRSGPDRPPSGTVDWDHETRQISAVRSFWDFLRDSPRQWWFG